MAFRPRFELRHHFSEENNLERFSITKARYQHSRRQKLVLTAEQVLCNMSGKSALSVEYISCLSTIFAILNDLTFMASCS
jgi:hypothetical protein